MPKADRRQFIAAGAVISGGALLPRAAVAQAGRIVKKGQLKQSVCRWCYEKIPLPEFAKAGWIADLTGAFPEAELRRDYVRGAVDAVIVDGRTMAVPWWIDVGVLYTRTDLADPPRTFGALVDAARRSPIWAGPAPRTRRRCRAR